MADSITNWEMMYWEMKDIAADALYLADAYASGESERAEVLQEQFDNLEAKENSVDLLI